MFIRLLKDHPQLLYQEWPTSERPRATFLKLCYRKEPHHTHGHTWTSLHLLTHIPLLR